MNAINFINKIKIKSRASVYRIEQPEVSENIFYFYNQDTRKGHLSAAMFPSWHGSEFYAALTININKNINFYPARTTLTTGSAPGINFRSRDCNSPWSTA